jgi:3-deoxy-manno-octulosonate cytidylyltransferase (CMP-KDO synthetase)
MRVLGVIPARLGSTRLPNKPLQLLAGEPLITRVIQRVMEHGVMQELVVATDSHMIAQVVERAGVRAVLTHDGHVSGTDRVAEAVGRPEFAGFDVVVNVQGDEPFVSREALAGAIDRITQGDDIGTAAGPLALVLASDPPRVKVGTDGRGRARYF